MKVDLEEEASFWKGIAAGFLAGIAVAAALRYTPFEKFLDRFSTIDGKLDSKPAALEPVTSGLYPWRYHPQSGGDSRLASDSAGVAAEAATPGEQVDHIDLSQPLRKYPRSFDMGSAG